jgi:hypothetical protein
LYCSGGGRAHEHVALRVANDFGGVKGVANGLNEFFLRSPLNDRARAFQSFCGGFTRSSFNAETHRQ